MGKMPVLTVLKQRRGEFVSGQELARASGVSRTAIWKQINRLREAGFSIEASTKRGYRLVSVADRLLPEEISWGLKTQVVGKRLIYFDEVGSTNEEAKRLATEGAGDGTVVVAERQAGGRGRQGRGWFSPAGGVWLSVILRPEIAATDAPKAMMVAVNAVVAVVKSLGVEASIKWPNDVLVGGRKLAGILTEMSSHAELVDHLIIGIGLNANVAADEYPPELSEFATSLQIEKEEPVDRVELVRCLLAELDRGYEVLKLGKFDAVVEEWRSGCETIGQTVELACHGRIVSGLALDVDDRGSLLLRLKNGFTKAFAAGDVTVVKKPVKAIGKN